jgi:hypothetical protein
MIQWIPFLEQHHIDYVDHGHNVTRGNVSIKCPWCVDDPSHHLGIQLSTGYWNCWRNENHRGRNPVRLIQALLGCSRLHAESLVNNSITLPLDNFDEIIKSLSQEAIPTEEKISKIVFPPNVKTLVDKGMGRKFIDYLVGRDYTRDEARHLAEVYWLMYAVTGPFAYRIIVPIEMEDGIATWTGRDITGTSETRYKTLSNVESRQSIKDCLFGYKSLLEDNEAHTLLVCEGPFDAMRADFFGYQLGIRATCLFGLQASDAQVSLLVRLASKFENKYVCLDAGAGPLQFYLRMKLAFLDFGMLGIPKPYKDPGELPKPVIRDWFKEIERRNLISKQQKIDLAVNYASCANSEAGESSVSGTE